MPITNSRNDGIEVLKEDHRTVESLFTRLESEIDQETLDEVVKELSVHAVIEEQVLYPALRNVLGEGDELADHSIDEHQEVKELLNSIEKGGADGEDTPTLVAELIANVRQHVREEENKIFPALRAATTPEQLAAMAEALEKAKKAAPTRPHPHAPSSPPGNVLAGAPTALIDKARDAISGRKS
jgi:hemerythrin superfamily protein